MSSSWRLAKVTGRGWCASRACTLHMEWLLLHTIVIKARRRTQAAGAGAATELLSWIKHHALLHRLACTASDLSAKLTRTEDLHPWQGRIQDFSQGRAPSGGLALECYWMVHLEWCLSGRPPQRPSPGSATAWVICGPPLRAGRGLSGWWRRPCCSRHWELAEVKLLVQGVALGGGSTVFAGPCWPGRLWRAAATRLWVWPRVVPSSAPRRLTAPSRLPTGGLTSGGWFDVSEGSFDVPRREDWRPESGRGTRCHSVRAACIRRTQ